MSNQAPAVVVANREGAVISRNLAARRLLGRNLEGPCWDVVGGLPGAEGLPCRRGCVLEMLAAGMDRARHTRFTVAGRKHHLSCAPVGDKVVCMFRREADELPEAWQSLTAREREVLERLAMGDTTGTVAQRLGVGESTIRTHVEKMRMKLGVNTRAALVAKGFRLGYLD